MSRIHEALERAERERERGLREDLYPTPVLDETRMERREKRHKSQKFLSFSQPKSLVAEQFRKLRTYLIQLKIPGPPKTIMVTSASDGEGKTFVSVNLAAGIATDLHAHALLVECDLRAPELANWFGLTDRKGLSDYLIGDYRVSDLMMRTEVEKLSILPGGSVPGNPTELIGSKKMEALVLELKSRYSDRYIIFDSTPLLATAEPEVLSKWVDGIIIVVRAGVTPRETVKQALSSIDKGKILGVVLNDLRFKSSGLSSRYFGSDGYYYRQGDGEKGKSKHRRGWERILCFNRRPD